MDRYQNKRIVVTGGAGYVGSAVVDHMLNAGYHVTALDKLMFGGEGLLPFWHRPNFEFAPLDLCDHPGVRNFFERHSFNSVIHLAAIVGDPACSKYPDLAEKTNWEAAVNLVNCCAANGVERFVFASTCSNYGKMETGNEYVTEDSKLAPVSLYAELKVKFERYLLEADFAKGFCPTALRFSTVYGISPRMRFDLTINEFVKEVALGRKLEIFGENFWRPYCHVVDFSRAFEIVINSPKNLVSRDVFNVGSTKENYTKAMIWNLIERVMPLAECKFVEKAEDPRDYRVSFEKIKNILGFEPTRLVLDGIQEVSLALDAGVFQHPDSNRHRNA